MTFSRYYGPEFVAQALRKWLLRLGTRSLYIEPGSPWENGYCESFNSKLRDECFHESFFFGLAEARHLIEAWRQDYNQLRRTAVWVLRPQPNTPTSKGAIRLSKLRAPQPAPLLHRPNWGKTSTPDSTHKRAYVGVQTNYYQRTRTHLSLKKDCPDRLPLMPPRIGTVIAIPQVSGLHHRYERLAA
jgi:Integrase core domain